MGKLYICATPIGNLEDITLRALRILREVDLIACEDTRHTKHLLDRYDIEKPLTSYHKFSRSSKAEHIISIIKEGRSVALVSDAGMPGISDPGEGLIRQAIRAGIEVVPIPGPSAFVAALAASGLSTDKFFFQGFLPSKRSERMDRLKKAAVEEGTLIFYEAPHRIIETLLDMKEVLGDRYVVLAREITKKFEEFIRGNASEVLHKLRTAPPKGEFVLIVEGAKEASPIKDEAVAKQIRGLLKMGISKRDAAQFMSNYSGLPKNKIYDMVQNI